MKKRLPPGIPSIPTGTIRTDLQSQIDLKRMRPSSGIGALSLGLAKVVTINYEEMSVTLRQVIGGDDEYLRAPVPLTFPGVGKRLFLGSMPQEGDFCVIGWVLQHSGGSGTTPGTKIPVILTWAPAGVWTGQDWMTTQPFATDEWPFDPKASSQVAGVFERVRHKLRHLQPGNILASSAQGSDISLDESILISNRRGNELHLRDQDQSLVVRTLQQFHAMAGVRLYGGMVQRDARLLPTPMFSDGLDWQDPMQVPLGGDGPLHEEDLFESLFPDGFLTPASVLQKSPEENGLSPAFGPPLSPDLDPYQFLQRGSIINAQGYLINPNEIPDAEYGGKPYYRVSSPYEGSVENSATNPDVPSLTEYRLEITHLSDGTLPVTEQTDLFDADRLPPGVDAPNPSLPFMEWVLGTVVGNDAFSSSGLEKYGLPLRPTIFEESGDFSPKLESALGAPIGEHAASLFSVDPPHDPDLPTTFWSVRKDGTLRFSIGGATRGNSVEGGLFGGLHLRVEGYTVLDFEGGYRILSKKGDPTDNCGILLTSEQGAVVIYGGGERNTGRTAEDVAPAGLNSPNPSPSLLLEGKNTVEVKGSQNVFIRSSLIQTTGSNIRQEAMSSLEMRSGDRASIESKVFDVVSHGKSTQMYGGPKDNLPSNGPLREVSVTTLIPGLVVDKYSIHFGHREENINVGNHTTSIKVGNLTYETNAGTWKARAGSNSLALDVASGITGDVVTGNISLEAKAGAVLLSGTLSATMKTNGQATVSGSNGVYLGGGPVAKTGLIICSSDLDPLTGLPLQTYGMGSPAHRIGNAI